MKLSHNRENYDKIALVPHKDKIQCKICGLWYKKPLGHVFQRHGMDARQYKIKFGYPIKKGIVGKKLHNRFVEMGKENPSWRVNLLIKGRKYRFKIGHTLNKIFQWIKEKVKRIWM
jgi:hypothetical protein